MSNKIFLAVYNPLTGDDRAVRRAAQLAGSLGAGVFQQALVHYPELARDLFHISGALEQARVDLEQDCLARLTALATELGLDPEAKAAVWGHPFDAGMGAVIGERSPDLVVIGLRGEQGPSTAEWRLIRSCPVPLWIVGTRAWGASPSVMSCVDPSHEHDKPAELDRDILAWSGQLASQAGFLEHVLHAAGMLPRLSGSDPYPDDYRARVERERSEEILAMIGAERAEAVQLHFTHTTPPEAIEAFASARQVDVVVMGSMSRRWLQDRLIGGTVRSVLPRLNCDVLLVPVGRAKNRQESA